MDRKGRNLGNQMSKVVSEGQMGSLCEAVSNKDLGEEVVRFEEPLPSVA